MIRWFVRSARALWARWRGPILFIRALWDFGSAAMFGYMWLIHAGRLSGGSLWSEVTAEVFAAFAGSMSLFYATIGMCLLMGLRRSGKAAYAGVRT